MTDVHLVVLAGVVLASLCFVIYVIETVAALALKPMKEAKNVAEQAGRAAHEAQVQQKGIAPIPRPTLPEFTALMEGMAKLIDSLSKAGPGLTSIVAAILFLLIAAIGSGAFQGAAEKPKDATELSANPKADNAEKSAPAATPDTSKSSQ